MPSNEDIQRGLAPLFRAAELDRREARRKILVNHLQLETEPLPDDKIEREALTHLACSSEAFLDRVEARRKELIEEQAWNLFRAREIAIRRAGYWRRLWLAILNRDPE